MRKSGMLLSSLLVMLGCGKTMIVEAKDVKFFEMAPSTTPDGVVAVRLRGLVFHSSLSVKHIDMHAEGDAMQVNVELAPATKGTSGSFDIEVPLLNGSKRITFGPDKTQIWSKS